jgi:hypothetical protein
MKRYFLSLITVMLMFIATTTPAAESLETFTKTIEAACAKHDAEALWGLYFVKGQPDELTPLAKSLGNWVLKNKEMQVQSVGAIKFEDYNANPETPVKFNGKEFEFLIKPTHWIAISMATPEGKSPKMSKSIKVAAAQVNGEWKLIGLRFKK